VLPAPVELRPGVRIRVSSRLESRGRGMFPQTGRDNQEWEANGRPEPRYTVKLPPRATSRTRTWESAVMGGATVDYVISRPAHKYYPLSVDVGHRLQPLTLANGATAATGLRSFLGLWWPVQECCGFSDTRLEPVGQSAELGRAEWAHVIFRASPCCGGPSTVASAMPIYRRAICLLRRRAAAT